MKNNFELNQINESEMNTAIELSESEMKDLAGGYRVLNGCTGGITNMPFFCPQEESCNI